MTRHDAPTGRLCARCDRELPRSEFPANRHMLDGLSSWCRQCAAARTRQWRAEVRDEYNSRRHVHNPERPCEGCGLPIAGRIDKRFCCVSCRIYHPAGEDTTGWRAAHWQGHEGGR